MTRVTFPTGSLKKTVAGNAPIFSETAMQVALVLLDSPRPPLDSHLQEIWKLPLAKGSDCTLGLSHRHCIEVVQAPSI